MRLSDRRAGSWKAHGSGPEQWLYHLMSDSMIQWAQVRKPFCAAEQLLLSADLDCISMPVFAAARQHRSSFASASQTSTEGALFHYSPN
jgi:hypothetical protein